jgi:hypothetical protein
VKIRIGIGIAAIGTLAALAIPATAATASLAVAASPAARSGPAAINTSFISSYYDSNFLLDHGQGYLLTMAQFEYSTYYPIQDGSSKWWEIQDTHTPGNQCLDLTGNGSGGVYYVNTEVCNDRSAELWWFPSGITNTNQAYEIINQYGTKLLSHDACLFNNESGTDPKVEKCSSQSGDSYQLWQTNF